MEAYIGRIVPSSSSILFRLSSVRSFIFPSKNTQGSPVAFVSVMQIENSGSAISINCFGTKMTAPRDEFVPMQNGPIASVSTRRTFSG
jgi:hypothetical protein